MPPRAHRLAHSRILEARTLPPLGSHQLRQTRSSYARSQSFRPRPNLLAACTRPTWLQGMARHGGFPPRSSSAAETKTNRGVVSRPRATSASFRKDNHPGQPSLPGRSSGVMAGRRAWDRPRVLALFVHALARRPAGPMGDGWFQQRHPGTAQLEPWSSLHRPCQDPAPASAAGSVLARPEGATAALLVGDERSRPPNRPAMAPC